MKLIQIKCESHIKMAFFEWTLMRTSQAIASLAVLIPPAGLKPTRNPVASWYSLHFQYWTSNFRSLALVFLKRWCFFTWWLCTWPGRPAGWRSPPPCLGNSGNKLLLFLFISKQSLFSFTFTATGSSTSLQAFLSIILQLLACAGLDEVAASHHAD